MAIFGYKRVNTRQELDATPRCDIEHAGYAVAYMFADEGVSSNVPALRRAQFRALLDRISAWDTLVVSRLDCLGRNAHDIGSTIRMLAGRRIKIIVVQLGALDLCSAAGQMMLNALAAIAEMDRGLSAERIRAGLSRAEAQGKTLGRPVCTTAQQRASIIRRHQAGESISSLARAESLSRASVMRIVKPARLQ